MVGDSNPFGDSNTLESEIALLKRMPKEHYTEYLGRSLTVGQLIKEIEQELDRRADQVIKIG
ncbi:MAG: hypothetical protein EBR30_01120 [Cytophagia bacterium]|jgi:hypothetical protein|nr:hypothetical protein [Cytophagia bacterium]